MFLCCFCFKDSFIFFEMSTRMRLWWRSMTTYSPFQEKLAIAFIFPLMTQSHGKATCRGPYGLNRQCHTLQHSCSTRLQATVREMSLHSSPKVKTSLFELTNTILDHVSCRLIFSSRIYTSYM